MPRTWITSDTHFGHSNVLAYDKRPYAAIKEHDEALIHNWNALVAPGDLVYHLGDFALCRPDYAASVAGRLAGTKILVLGNHDGKQMRRALKPHFAAIKDYEEVMICSRKVVLMHYPILSWRAMHHGSVMLHGHCHGSLRSSFARRIDVGVPCWGYMPVSLGEAVWTALQKPGLVVDGHV